MYYAELDGNKVRFVGGGEDYTILPPNSIEIDSLDDVHAGMVYENGIFREPTEEEILAPSLAAFRAERDRLFVVTQWIRERHFDRAELNIDDSENWTAWLNYWQALRDLPATDKFDPREPIWPEVPE